MAGEMARSEEIISKTLTIGAYNRVEAQPMKKLAIPLMVLSLAVILWAEKKPRVWQQGTLKDVTSETGSRLGGVYSGRQGSTPGHGSIGSQRNDATFYVIESGDYTYIAKRTLISYRDKQLPLTVNDAVKFAVEKDDFYLQDDRGKEHKLTIEKKTRNEKKEQR